MTKQDGGAGKHKERQRVTKSPGQTMLDNVGDLGAPGGNAGYRRDVIGLERVLHPEQKTEAQDSQHPFSLQYGVKAVPWTFGSTANAKVDFSGICRRLGKIKNRDSRFNAMRCAPPRPSVYQAESA